jgi:hypothetical protein
MSNRKRRGWPRRVRGLTLRLRGALALVWAALRGADAVPIVVLLVDRDRRRAIARDLRAGLRRLRPVLGDAVTRGLAVVVQQSIPASPHLAGCRHVGQHADGGRRTVLRLALRVDGRTLGSDELLAVLAEQCVALAAERGGPSALVPIELHAAEPVATHESRPVDPLAAHADGRAAGPFERAA